MSEIVNKVAQSKIFTFDMEEVLPSLDDIVYFDLKDFLFQGLVLREKQFRGDLKEIDWNQYQDQIVIVKCSADAIVPIWAYMLVETYLLPVVAHVGNNEQSLFSQIIARSIEEIDNEINLSDRPIVIKGCSNVPFKEHVYMEATKFLLPFSKSLMYGEPCSTVPIYKKRKKE